MITDIVSTTGMLLAFVVILFLAWQASRYLGKNASYEKRGEDADTGTTKSRKRSVHYPS